MDSKPTKFDALTRQLSAISRSASLPDSFRAKYAANRCIDSWVDSATLSRGRFAGEMFQGLNALPT